MTGAKHNPDGPSALSRRDAIVALLATASALSACDRAPEVASSADADVLALLDELAENLLRLSPETATSLGVDVGARAALRSQLGDRSAEGQQRIASQLRADLARADGIDASGLGDATRLRFDASLRLALRHCRIDARAGNDGRRSALDGVDSNTIRLNAVRGAQQHAAVRDLLSARRCAARSDER